MTHGRHLFVSDLHLDAALPGAISAFTGFLAGAARDCDGLYILGDLFETWVGDDDDEAARSEVCAALRMLTDAGVPCWVQHGNRDFLLGEGFTRRTGCQLLPDPARLETGRVRAVISHGDLLCTADHRYQHFRSLVRARDFQQGYLSLPLATRRAAAARARAGSRQHLRQQSQAITDVSPDAVATLLRIADCDLLIHGHTHRPAVHHFDLDGRRRTRVVLGDWYEQGSCLVLRDDGSYTFEALPPFPSSVSRASSSMRV